jgi:hypothetical protein
MRCWSLMTMLACVGCQETSDFTAPVVDPNALSISVDPDRPLAKGEMVRLTVTAASDQIAFGADSALGFVLPSDVTTVGAPVQRTSIPAGGTAAVSVALQVPGDDVYRRVVAFGRGVTADGRVVTATKLIDLNAAGAPQASTRSDGEWTTPVLLTLSADKRLMRSTDVGLTLHADVDAASSSFQLGFDLPAGVQLSSGELMTAPAPVAAGGTAEAKIGVHLPDGDTPLALRGFAQFPNADPPANGVAVILVTTP